jgi:hypothetical protein
MNCPNCGRSNPDDRDLCYNCDQPLPHKKETPKRGSQTGRMGMWTWIILLVLGALFFFRSCTQRTATPPATFVPPALMQTGQPAYPLT